MLVPHADGEPRFIKSSFSGASGSCVEVGRQQLDHVVVRHSRGGGPVLQFSVAEWVAFVEGVKTGEFDVD